LRAVERAEAEVIHDQGREVVVAVLRDRRGLRIAEDAEPA
jgi:hypothetical protein